MMTVLFIVFLILSFPFKGVALTLKTSSKITGVASNVTNTVIAKPLRRRAFKATTKVALERTPKLRAIRLAKATALNVGAAKATKTVIELKASQVALVAASLAAKALSAFFRGASIICSWLIPIDIYITVTILVVMIVSGAAIVLYYGDEAEEHHKEENKIQEEVTTQETSEETSEEASDTKEEVSEEASACVEEDINIWIM